MAEYVNQVNVNIGEIVKLTFNDVDTSGNPQSSTRLVMHYDMLKILYSTIGNTISQHELNLANANKEKDKDLN